MISRVIHYCWFGHGKKSELMERCIASWKKYCPDYKIIEWNESNYDISKNPYMKEAYDAKRWGFASDFARLDIVYTHGGIYLDTDVELYRSLDDLLQYDAFFSFESTINLNGGQGFGAVKGDITVKACMDYYKNRHFVRPDGEFDLLPCPRPNTESVKNVVPEFKRNGKTQIIGTRMFLSTDDYNSYAKHWGAASWVEDMPSRSGYKDWKIKRILRDENKFSFIEKHFPKKVYYIYTFCVYDLLEMGPFYYMKRLMKKFARRFRRKKS